MITRIRYTSKENQLLTPEMVAGKSLVVGSINVETKTYTVVAVDTGAVLSTGHAETLTTMKKGLKSSLMACGVVFTPEVRNREILVEDEDFIEHEEPSEDEKTG